MPRFTLTSMRFEKFKINWPIHFLKLSNFSEQSLHVLKSLNKTFVTTLCLLTNQIVYIICYHSYWLCNEQEAVKHFEELIRGIAQLEGTNWSIFSERFYCHEK